MIIMEKRFYKTFRSALKDANLLVKDRRYDNYMTFNGYETAESLMGAERIGFEPDFTFSGEVPCITLFDKDLNPVMRLAWWENNNE